VGEHDELAAVRQAPCQLDGIASLAVVRREVVNNQGNFHAARRQAGSGRWRDASSGPLAAPYRSGDECAREIELARCGPGGGSSAGAELVAITASGGALGRERMARADRLPDPGRLDVPLPAECGRTRVPPAVAGPAPGARVRRFRGGDEVRRAGGAPR